MKTLDTIADLDEARTQKFAFVFVAVNGLFNRESLNRTNFRFLKVATIEVMTQIVDGIALEFAEQYSANS